MGASIASRAGSGLRAVPLHRRQQHMKSATFGTPRAWVDRSLPLREASPSAMIDRGPTAPLQKPSAGSRPAARGRARRVGCGAIWMSLAWLATGGWGLAATATRPMVGGLEGPGIRSPRLVGTVLLGELSCAACHATSHPWLHAKGGATLSEAGARLNPAHLRRFLAAPSHTKPGTTMPDMLAGLSERDREATALALTHYLMSLGGPRPGVEPPVPEAIQRGKALYHAVGCVACHAPEPGDPSSVPLGVLEEKYSVATLTRFLEDPLAIRPAGRMPDLHLDHFEAVDLASYLLRHPPPATEPFLLDAQLAERGKDLFAQHRCGNCHEVGGSTLPPSLTALDRVRPDQGCLSEAPGPWPRYPLSPEQRAAIRTALDASNAPPGPAEHLDAALTRLNCLACHARGGLGGVAASRDVYFTGKDENLGEQGRLPPPLTGVGAKLKRGWLREVVVNGASVRPYLNTRMPRFGEAPSALMVEWFKQLDRLPPEGFARADDSEKPRDVGRELAGAKGFNCVACHTFRERSAAPIRALDLTTLTERLEEDWFHRYLANPQRVSPLTIMPGFWPDGTSLLPEVLGGDPGKQRDALWRYLAQGPEAGEPRGLVLEPLILAVADEAVMLRRSYPGIGKRGIGVGYPSGIHLAFDAGQMRLGSIWSGGFIEASGVWRGQGAGNVQILGRDTVNFPAGPAFAILDSASSAWPTNLSKQAEGFQFKGYSLDPKQRPTFRYQFGDLTIEDHFLDLAEAGSKPHFRRTLRFPGGSPPPGLHLRLAAEGQLESMNDREFVVGGRLRLRLSVAGQRRPTNDGAELIVPVTTAAPITVEYHLNGQP